MQTTHSIQGNLAPAPNSWSALMHAANFYNNPVALNMSDPMFGCNTTSSTSSNMNNPINMSLNDEAAASTSGQFRNASGDGNEGGLAEVDEQQQQRLLPNQAIINIPLLQQLVQTCCVRVDEPELSRAIETIRAFIMLNELQQALADVQRRKRRQQKQP
jgi:hypothetical protein